jgi:predicted TIM-barrel enzyme
MSRTRVLAALHAEVAASRPLVVAGVGTGLTARAALDGGADLLVAYHSAPLRLAGLPSIAGMLPVARANDLVDEIAGPILRAAAGAPVLATAHAADPATDLQALHARGFVGVMTAPTATLADGELRGQLEAAGLGFGAELALIEAARTLDLVTCMYATTPEEARAAADAGADLIVAHLGVTGAAVGAAHTRLRTIAAACGEALVLAHGGPLSTPQAVHAALADCPTLAGSFGASAIERLPIERAVRAATAAFKHTNPAALALDAPAYASQHGRDDRAAHPRHPGRRAG